MTWHIIVMDEFQTTWGMEVPGGVVVRVTNRSLEQETMILVPDCSMMVGSCGEKAKLVASTLSGKAVT